MNYVQEISPTTSTFPIGSAPLTSRTSLLYENGAGGDPLVSALVEYMERGERLWEEHRSEGFRLLKGVAVGLAAGLSASSDSTLGIASYVKRSNAY